jgi:hypothetical protein
LELSYTHKKFIEDVGRLQLKFPVASVAKVTGESKGNVSNFLNKKKEPSDNFLRTFYEKVKLRAFKDEPQARQLVKGNELAEDDPGYRRVFISYHSTMEAEIERLRETLVLLKEVIAEKNRTIEDQKHVIDTLKKHNNNAHPAGDTIKAGI